MKSARKRQIFYTRIMRTGTLISNRKLRFRRTCPSGPVAIYSFVLSPFSDNIRLVRNESSGPMFKNVVPENEFTRITQSMTSGEEVHYALILANVHKKGLQKVEFTIKSINHMEYI